MVRLVLIALALLAGCKFSPQIADGTVRCGAAGSCPPSLSCAPDGTCRRAAGADDLGDAGASADLAGADDLSSTSSDGPPGADLVMVSQDLASADLTCVKAVCPGNGCGFMLDGCGGKIDCGSTACGSGKACGAKQLNQCGPGSCTPSPSCASLGKNCGLVSNGCDNVLDCGACASGTCGGGGVSNVCG